MEISYDSYISKWNKPEKDSSFLRTALLVEAVADLTYCVTRVVFTAISLLPGTSHEWVRENILDINTYAKFGPLSDGSELEGNLYPAFRIQPLIYKAVVLTINPWAKIDVPDNDPLQCKSLHLFQLAQEYSKKESSMDDDWEIWAKRELLSRLTYFAATVAITVEKVAYLALGYFMAIIAIPLNILYASGRESAKECMNDVNQLAVRFLSAGGFIDNLIDGIHATIWPSDFVDTKYKISEQDDSLASTDLLSDEDSFPAFKIQPLIYKLVFFLINPWAKIDLPKDDPLRCKSHFLFERAQKYSEAGIEKKERRDEVQLFMDESEVKAPVETKEETPSVDDSWEDWAQRELLSRLTYLTATLAITLEKTAYLALGYFMAIVALPLNILYVLGCESVKDWMDKANNWAVYFLCAGGVIDDLINGIHATIWPSDFVDTNYKIPEDDDSLVSCPSEEKTLEEDQFEPLFSTPIKKESK